MVRIRPARLSDASTIADIQVVTWRDTYAGLIPDRTLLGLSRTSHIENWRGILRDTRGHNITRVAEGPDACIVGFANAARSPDRPGPVALLEAVIEHQARRTPSKVGGPVDIIRLTTKGVEWQQRKLGCRESE